MIELVNVTSVEPQDGSRLRVRFSNGAIGIRDLSDLLAEGGPMVEPLRDPAFFRRVFVQCGVLTWPNGFDLDAVRLHDEMRAAGLLERDPANCHAAE
jgi:uncharacterized protein DUF2442